MANLRRAKRGVVNVLKTLSSQVITMYPVIVFLIFDCAWNPGLLGVHANPDAKRLYDDLLSNYNRLIRPVINHTDKVTVKLGVSLSQLVELVSIIAFLISLLAVLVIDYLIRILSQQRINFIKNI